MFTKKEILPIAVIVFIVLLTMFVYTSLPTEIPSHWNAQGEIDAYSSRTFTVLFFPAIIIGVYLLMMFIPNIDPLKRNYPSFKVPYYWFKTAFVVFFSALYLFTIWTAMGENLNINYFIIPAFALLFIVIGLFLPKVEKNYFVGIKTPWTLASEEVWKRTHNLGGRLFILVGIITLLGFFFFEQAIFIFLISIIAAVIILFVYSYLIYKRVEGFNNNK